MNPTASSISPEFSPADTAHMRRALALARKAAGKTYPNPAVGAVIVREGKVVGEGYHHRTGLPHAEREALADCRRNGVSPEGATLYVTLEPCNHRGRTLPCTEAILEAGIRQVIGATRDPNRAVFGGGYDHLRAAGVEVRTGLLADEAFQLNETYYHFHETGRPWVTLKWAMTLDGCTSAQSGAAFWITGEAARRDSHRLRAHHACVAVGIGTVLTDDPQLTVRMVRWKGPTPLRLVVDSRLVLPETSNVLTVDPETLIVATCEPPDSPKALHLKERGVLMIHVPAASDPVQVSISQLVHHLGDLGVQSVLVEGGRRLAGAFFAERLANRVVAYVAPRLLGSGEMALGALMGGGLLRPSDGPVLRDLRIRRVGNDYRLEGRPDWLTGK